MATRIFDVVTDPVFGWLGDKISSPWGRRRPALLVAVPFLAAGVYFAFFPGESPTATSLFLSMLLLYAGWTAFTISHTAWAGELSDDYDERSRIMGVLQVFGLLGILVVSALPALLDMSSAKVDMTQRTNIVGLVVLISLPIFALMSSVAVGEPTRKVQAPIVWREAVNSFVSNLPLRRLLLTDLLLGFQGGVNGTMHFFFIGIVLGLPQAASLMLVVIGVAGLVAAPIFVRVSYRIGKHRTLCLGALLSSVASLTHFFIPAGNFWLVFATFVLIGINIGARDMMIRSIMADVVDEDAVRTGRERGALFYSMLTLTAKLGAALAVGMVLPVLDWVGFDPAGENTEATITGVRMVVAATPTFALTAVAAIMWRFPLDKDRQRILRAELEARAAG